MAATAISLGCAALQSQAAFADTITVTTTDDEIADNAACSLREAVQAANTDSAVGGCPTGAGADTIIVPAGTYTLTLAGANEDGNLTGDLDITDTLVISGAGASETIIDANGIDRAIDSAAGGYTTTLRGLTVQHGIADYGGGAQLNSAAELTSVRFFTNTATGFGGGVYLNRNAAISASAFESNTAALLGGGLIANETVQVAGSLFAGNYALNGGGMLSTKLARIENSTFSDNSAYVSAGAEFRGEAVVVDSAFSHNTASGPAGGATFALTATVSGAQFFANNASDFGGAWFYNATATVTGTRFFSNTATGSVGGAAFNGDGVISQTTFESNASLNGEVGGAVFSGNARIASSEFLSNSAQYFAGGAVFYGEDTTVVDSVFAGNSTATSGGGICTAARITHCIAASARRNAGSGYVETGSAGGAIFARAATLTRTDFLNNSAPDSGGAGFYGVVSVTDGSFQSNLSTSPGCTDQCAGGAYFGAQTGISGTAFAGNTATNGAGGARFALTTTVTSGDFHSNTTRVGAGAAVFGGGEAEITDSSFTGNVATGSTVNPCPVALRFVCSTAAVASNAGESVGGATFGTGVRLTRATFADNSASGIGAARFGGPALIIDSVFTGNSNSNSTGEPKLAGAAYFESATTVSGTVFARNRGVNAAGGARFAGAAVISASQFVSNTAAPGYGGGAIFDAAAQVTSSDFTRNVAGYSGGGAYFAGIGISVIGSRFEANRSSELGGGALFGYTATVRGTQFISNTGWSGGGAHFVYFADIAGAQFISNTSTTFDGGGANFDLSASIADSRFSHNRSGRSGGAVNFVASAHITNTYFLNNHASLDGGGANVDSDALPLWGWWPLEKGVVRVTNSVFGGNSADGNGAAIYVHDTAGLTLMHVTIGSARLEPNQAVAVHAGVAYITNTIIASHSIGIERSAGTVNEDYTLFSGVTTARRGSITPGAHSRSGNAGFADPAADNYHLTGHSDALNAGVDSGVQIDIDGQPRAQGYGRGSDIGFDELLQWIQILTLVSKT